MLTSKTGLLIKDGAPNAPKSLDVSVWVTGIHLNNSAGRGLVSMCFGKTTQEAAGKTQSAAGHVSPGGLFGRNASLEWWELGWAEVRPGWSPGDGRTEGQEAPAAEPGCSFWGTLGGYQLGIWVVAWLLLLSDG